jgi:hypothetical protein
MRAAGWPVASAAEARQIRDDTERWAAGFVASGRAEDLIVIDYGTEADR